MKNSFQHVLVPTGEKAESPLKKCEFQSAVLLLLSAWMLVGGIDQASAQTIGSWNANANGNWSSGTNWVGGAIPNGAGDTANFTNNITAATTVTIDGGMPGSTVTLGVINFGDSSGGSSFTISGGRLVFNNNGANAQLNMGPASSNNTITSAITIQDPLDVTISDTSNSQGMTLSGAISGGTNGAATITLTDTSAASGTNGSLNYLVLQGASNFQGQIVVNSGLLRFDGANSTSYAGALGAGNETIVQSGGGVDLRDHDFNVANNNTEIFKIAGVGPNGLGALRNSTGTGVVSHIELTGDALVNSQGTIVLERHQGTGGTGGIASVLDFGAANYNLSKIGNADFVIRGVDVLNAAGATLSIHEGEVRFESRGLLGGTGASTGVNLDGLTVNIAYHRKPYDNVNLANGSRTTTDLFSVNINQTALQGNSVSNARFSVGSYWGASVTNTGTLAEQTKETLTFDGMTFNLNNGVIQREGHSEVGRTFDHIFTNVTVNLIGGGIGDDAFGNGNIFDIQGGSGSYNSTKGSFDHPGVTEFNGSFDNTSPGNNGTGFVVRGSRELRITGSSSAFDGDILVKQNTGRWVSNSFDRSNGGQAASVYFNMSLAGADGSLNQAGSITITRWGSVALLNNSANAVYASANNDDRLNDHGFTNLRNGYLLLETDVTTTNRENFGNMVADYGTNYLIIDTRAGGRFDGALQSYARNNGGVLKIYDANPGHTFGAGSSDDRLALIDTTGLVTSGANAPGTDQQRVVVGLFGGVLPTLSTPTISSHTRPLESVQGSYIMSGGGTGLMTLDGGYLRPLTAAEYSTAINPAAGVNWLVNTYIAPSGGNYGDRANYGARNVTTDTVINSLTISFDPVASGLAVPTATKDYVIIANDKTLTIQSGIINIISFVETPSANLEAVIRGGRIDMSGQAALINSNALWHDLDRDTPNWYELMTANSSFIRSSIVNATGLIKTGRSNLYLETANSISGNIYVSEQSALVARHTGALGLGGAGREVHVSGGGAFLLEYGTNISGLNLRVTDSIQATATVLRNEGTTHSTWGGDVILDVADAAGTSEFQGYTITARNNGTLSIYGNIYTDNNADFTDSDSFSDPPLVTTSIGETYTLNLYGQFRDVVTGNLGTDPLNADITSVFRTGDSATRLDANHALRFQMSGHDEGNVNVFQQWDATGRIDMRQGYFRVLYDPLTAAGSGGFYTDGARALITGNDGYTRAVLGGENSNSASGTYHSHLMLTQDGQVFNAPYLYAYNENRNGTLTIGGENESGSVYFGSLMNDQNFSLQFANHQAERDVRFLQVRGGTLVWNGRLDDENSTAQNFNASVSIVGPGTVVFNSNSIGASDIDRWNFMGGETHWGMMTGNDQFASNSTQALVGQSSWGGGGLVLDAQGTARSQQLNSHIWMLGGASYVNTQNNTTFILGNAAADLTRRAGSSLTFLEDGNGAINISAVGLSTTAGDFLGAWGVYGSAAAGVTDWAARQDSTGVQAFAGYTDDTFGASIHTHLTTGAALASDASTATVRFGGSAVLDLGGFMLTVDEGGILIPTAVAGPVSIANGTLTSGWSAGGRDLMFHHHGSGIATISAVISDSTGKVNFVNSGAGTTVLGGSNTYTGDTYLNGGVLQISSDENLGAVNGSIVKVVRVNIGSNGGSNVNDGELTLNTANAPTTAASIIFDTNGSQQVSNIVINNGGSGYSSGIYVNTRSDLSGNAGLWAILDSGNLHFNGGTLHVTDTMSLNAARTIFLGGNGGTLKVDAGKMLTIDGYITSEFSHVTTDNGFTSSNHIGTDFQPASDRNPDIGDLIITGGGTVMLRGAPDGTVRGNMLNSYGGITWINEGILRLGSAGTSASDGTLGTNRSWVDGTIIGPQGTLLLNTTSDPTIREWLTFRGQGYEGRGTLQTVGTARSYRLAGQLFLEEDVVINAKNASNIRFNEGGGTMYGSGNILRIGDGALQIYGNSPDWTGAIINGSGDFYMTSAGNLQGMTALTLERNSLFYYEAGSTSVNEFRDRLSDSLAIFTDGYIRMRMRSTAGVFSGKEDAGVLTAVGGVLGLEFDIGADIINGAPRLQGDYALWHFDEIVRTPGSTVQFRSLDAGTQFANGDFGISQWANVVGVQVDTPPDMIGTGDGSNGDAPIVAGFYAGVRPAWINAAGTGNVFNEDYTANRLVTVDTSVNGDHFLRPLKDSEYRVVAHPDLDTTTTIAWEDQGILGSQNAKIVGVTSDVGIGDGELTNRRNSILTIGTDPSRMPAEVNSLTFASETFADGVNGRGNYTAVYLNENSTLKINSGVIQVVNTGVQNRQGAAYDSGQNLDIRSTINGGFTDFAGQEANFYIGSLWVHYNTSDSLNAYRATDGDNNYLFMNSSITNANGLTKTGSASLILAARNYYTGLTSVTMGSLYARHDNALGFSDRVNVAGSGVLVVGYGARVSADLYVGKINGNNSALQLENGSVWAGDVIIDNVDSVGGTSMVRQFTPRIYANYTGMSAIDGDIYGGATPIGSGALTDSRMFSTYTGTSGILDIRGRVRDSAAGALAGPVTIYNQSQVLRMEVVANNNEASVGLWQQHDAAGRIRLLQGSLIYQGTGEFYTSAAAATVNSNPLNPMLGLQMGGRSVLSSDGASTGDNLSFFLANSGSHFNLSSWEVGVESYDPENLTGSDNYNRGNTDGNSTLGGLNLSGEVTFGTGDGIIQFVNMTRTGTGFNSYTRDLRLYAAGNGVVNLDVALVDGGTNVATSITKIGSGRVNLNGSSAGAGSVEAVNVLGGELHFTNYGTHASRRVANGAALLLGGGTLVMNGADAAFTENFSSLTLNQGGNALLAAGNGGSNIGTISIGGASITRNAAGTLHFQSIDGGMIRFSNAALQNVARIGSYATFGSTTGGSPFATDWAATDAAGNVVAYTGYGIDSFGAAVQTDVQGAGLTAATTNSARFNTAGGSVTGGSLTLNDGGILITSNYTTGTVIAAGVNVTTGATGTDLIIHNFATGIVHFDGSITGGQNVVFAGTGETSFASSGSVTSMVLSSTTTSNSYNVTVADTAGLTVGMDVTGANVAAGTKIVGITNGTTLVLSKMVMGAGITDLTYSSTSYATTNIYSGGTHIVGTATVSFNNTGVFGSTSGFFLNGGTLNYTETGRFSDMLTQNIVLGGGNGTLSVADAGSTLIIRGATNQISSETNNIIAAYGANNPNNGGLNIIGSGTVQFGDRSAATTATQDLLGVINNYTGLTIIGDGVNAVRVDIQGQGNDNAQYSVFGTTESWADATIVRHNATIEFSMKRGDGTRDGQIRFREWFQIGEQAGDQILFDGSTQRQPTLDGVLNIIGDLTFQTQGNRYGDAGSTGNSEFLINPNEGGLMGSGSIIKLGDGNLKFYAPLHEWTGDLDIRDGFVGLYMNNGALFNPDGVVYVGDPTGGQTSTIQLRIENRHVSNNTTGLDAANLDYTFNRDIIIRDNIRQEVRIAAGYLPASSMVHFTNSIHVGSGSSAGVPVRIYYEDSSNLDASIVGHVQEAVFDITGSITGSNAIFVDGNHSGGTQGNGARFIVWLRGDNSGYSGRITIGGDNGNTNNPGRYAAVRIGSDTALGSNSVIAFRNHGILQLGGYSTVFTQDMLFTGGVGLSNTSRIENASETAAVLTFDSGDKEGPVYQDIGVGIRDGIAQGYFGGISSSLSVVKTGSGHTVFGASTGGNDVMDGFSSYTGNTLVQEGTLYAGSNNSFSPYSRFIISDGARLSPYWDNAQTGWIVTIGSLAGTSGASVNIENSTFSIGGDDTSDADFTGVISGLGSLFKVGFGAQTLSGVNTFSGNLGVLTGTLIGASNSAFGDAGNTINLGGIAFVTSTMLDAKIELLLAGSANAVANSVTMNSYDGNDEGIVVIGTRETSGTYGFDPSATVSLYQDYSTNVFLEAAGDAVFQFGGSIMDSSAGTLPLRKIGRGTVELHSYNSYGAGGSWAAGSAIDGGTIVRHGTLSIFNDFALSNTVVELGDTRHELAAAVYLATTRSLITSSGGSFNPGSDGVGGSGSGAFLKVSAVVDGVTLTAADVGKRILVKDEGANPERNGVYVIVSVDESRTQMNLARAADFDEAAEMLYGTSVRVTAGVTQAGGSFFMASADVDTVNGTDADPVHWLADEENPDVALIAGASGLSIIHDIDINDTNGSGRTVIGGSFTSGYAYFHGNITLQHSTLPGVDNVRELTVTSSSDDNSGTPGENGVIFTGIISEADSSGTLSINKVGTGTVTFTNANTYTGKTTVTEGTLALAGSGSVSSTSWIEVNNGATFDFEATNMDFVFDRTISGSGTVVTGAGGSLVVGTDGGAGELRPGMSSVPGSIGTAGDQIGVLTIQGNLVLSGDSTGVTRLTLQMGGANGADYNDSANILASLGMGTGSYSAYIASQAGFYDSQTGGNHDRVAVTGSFSMDSGGIIRFTGGSGSYQPVMGDVFNLLDWSSADPNGFDVGNGGAFRSGGLLGDLELPDLSLSGLLYDTSLFFSHGIIVVVPEPGRMSLLLAGLLVVLFRRRR